MFGRSVNALFRVTILCSSCIGNSANNKIGVGGGGGSYSLWYVVEMRVYLHNNIASEV